MSDIIVGSVGVQLVPSAKGFPEKTKALLSNLKADVTLNADTAKAKAQLDEAAHDRDSEIHAHADTAEANAKLDRAARTRKATILPDVSGLGVLTTGLLALGPALVPITAAATGLVAALGAPVAAVAGGGAVYGLIAGKAVKDTEKQSKAIDQLKAKVDAAQVSVSKATTPAGKKSAMATLATDTKAYNDALAKLNPAQVKFLDAQSKLGAAFSKLTTTAGPAIFGPLISGMDALSSIMPKLAPVITPVSRAIGDLLGEVERSARSGAISDFLGFLSSASGPAIRDAGHFLGNIALGFGQIADAFRPVGKSVTQDLLGWSRGFAQVGRSKDLKDFVSYVEQVGPQVARTLGDVGAAAGHIAKALAPLGGVALDVIDHLAKGVSKIPTGILTAAAGSFAAIAVALKGISLANKGIGVLNKIPGINIGGKSGGLTAAEGALGRTAAKGVVPVYVTNKGFGEGMPGGGSGPGGGKLGILDRIIGGGAGGALALGGTVAALGAGFVALNEGVKFLDRWHVDQVNNPVNPGTRFAPTDPRADIVAAQHGQTAADTTRQAAQLQKVIDILHKVDPAAGSAQTAMNDLGNAIETSVSEHNTKGFDTLTKLSRASGMSITGLLKMFPPLDAELKKAGDGSSLLGLKLTSLPSAVATKIETPGAVESGKDIAKLANQYNLTPKQVKTVVNLLGQEGALRDVTKLGRAYGLTPKQVRTLISQSGMDSSQAAIRRLAQLYDLTPKQVQTLISARDSATSVIARIKSELAHIPRSISTQVFVNRTTAHNKPHVLPAQADGGTVPGQRWPYGDKVLIAAAPGEEVITNRHGQADRFRADRAAGRIPAYADGGTVTKKKKKPDVLTQAEFNQAAYAFDLSLPMTIRQIDNEFHSLATTIHRDSGHLSDALGKLRKSAIGLVDPFSRASNRLSTARSEKSSAISTAVGSFNNDLFSGSLGDFLTGAHADINDITGMMAAIGKAKKKGLSGPLAAALEGSGNVALAQQFAGASRSQISYYEHLFATRANDQASLGKQAGSFYDPTIGKLSAEVAHLRNAINRMEKAAQAQIAAANKLPHEVRKGAHDGTREGNDARDKRGANRRHTR